jgi:hypothetical protein
MSSEVQAMPDPVAHTSSSPLPAPTTAPAPAVLGQPLTNPLPSAPIQQSLGIVQVVSAAPLPPSETESISATCAPESSTPMEPEAAAAAVSPSVAAATAALSAPAPAAPFVASFAPSQPSAASGSQPTQVGPQERVWSEEEHSLFLQVKQNRMSAIHSLALFSPPHFPAEH